MDNLWWFLLGFVFGVVSLIMYAVLVVSGKESRAEEKALTKGSEKDASESLSGTIGKTGQSD